MLLNVFRKLSTNSQNRKARRASGSGRLELLSLEQRITPTSSNAPWYPSLSAFEHYDSGRSHVFPQASFGGSYTGSNTVTSIQSATNQYPSGYNMVYLDANNIFIYGGGYGNVATSIGPFVAKVDPVTLAPIWYNQLLNTSPTGADSAQWDYPGATAILSDGYIFVVSGYHLWKLNPVDGNIVGSLDLPTATGYSPNDTAYNGIEATPNGTLILKNLYRQAGCTTQGPAAITGCSNSGTPIPPSLLVSVNPSTMQQLSAITLPVPAGARPSVSQFNGKTYVYLCENNGIWSPYGDIPAQAVRYIVSDAGQFTLDTSWVPSISITPLIGQTSNTSLLVMNDWVVVTNNSVHSDKNMSIVAINQGDASQTLEIEPFLTDAPNPFLVSAYGGKISWVDASLTVDPASNLIYAFDTVKQKIAAISLTTTGGISGLQTIWKVSQTTTEFTMLIGSADNRVLVTTDIPVNPNVPGPNSKQAYVVWRNASTGVELARSDLLPAMTQGTMIQPYYNGKVFFEGQNGTLFRLTPTSTAPLVTGTSALASSSGSSTVSLYDPVTGQPTGTAVPFPGFTGSIHVASGDFNNDGVADIFAAAGPGGGPAIAILDSQTGEVLESFFAFAPSFTGGVFIAVQDFNGDGFLDIIAGAGAGGGPEVRIFDGSNLSVLKSFYAYAQDFTGGVRVATLDFNGDGTLDLVTGAGPGGAPHVKVFDGATNSILSQWYAYPADFTGGVYVAAGDIGNDGTIEIVTGAGSGGAPVVAVWDPYTGTLLAQFYAYAESFKGGVRVGINDGNSDGILDLITGAGAGGAPEVKGFDFPALDLLFSFYSGDPANTGGVYVS